MEIKHIGFIMDGNRRYSKKQGISLKNGYKKGMEKFLEIISYQVKYNIPQTSFFALSQDNGKKRSKEELKAIFELLEFFSKNEAVENFFKTYKIKINLVGDIEGLKKETKAKKIAKKQFMDLLDKKFNEWNEEINEGDYTVNIALNYDGQNEILHSFKSILKKIEEGKLKADKITEKHIKENLWFQEESANIIVRTGDAPRISGFMLWDSKYSELYLTKKLWPELDEADFVSIISWYKNLNRNFGK